MSDLIDRHEAIRDIRLMDVCVIYDDMCSTEEAVEKAIVATKRNAIFGLECINSAEPRKKGKWIDLRCDQCGQVDCSKPNFCPNCGADMREGEEE